MRCAGRSGQHISLRLISLKLYDSVRPKGRSALGAAINIMPSRLPAPGRILPVDIGLQKGMEPAGWPLSIGPSLHSPQCMQRIIFGYTSRRDRLLRFRHGKFVCQIEYVVQGETQLCGDSLHGPK